VVEITCVPVELWHVEHVAEHMRDADRHEVLVLGGLTPREALDMSLASTGPRWTALFNGEPAAIFGVASISLMGGTGIAWLLGTALLETHWRAFAKTSRPVIRELLARYDRLINTLHVDNTLSMRWLTWLGASIQLDGHLARFELCAM